jgi:hypothetical protein
VGGVTTFWNPILDTFCDIIRQEILLFVKCMGFNRTLFSLMFAKRTKLDPHFAHNIAYP